MRNRAVGEIPRHPDRSPGIWPNSTCQRKHVKERHRAAHLDHSRGANRANHRDRLGMHSRNIHRDIRLNIKSFELLLQQRLGLMRSQPANMETAEKRQIHLARSVNMKELVRDLLRLQAPNRNFIARRQRIDQWHGRLVVAIQESRRRRGILRTHGLANGQNVHRLSVHWLNVHRLSVDWLGAYWLPRPSDNHKNKRPRNSAYTESGAGLSSTSAVRC